MFNSISKRLAQNEKHFKSLEINSAEMATNLLVDNSFSDLTFDQITVSGDKIQSISDNAFGQTAETVTSFWCYSCYITDTDVWSPINKMYQLTSLTIGFNNIEIPMNALNSSNKLKFISVFGSNVTIKSGAFENLDSLIGLNISFTSVQKFEKESFSFEKQSNQKLNMTFTDIVVGGDSFESGTFNGIQRPIQIEFTFQSEIDYLPETSFKSLLDNKPNKIQFSHNSYIDCENCGNQWLIKDDKQQQIDNPVCKGNISKNLFDSDIKDKLKKKCG